MTKRHFALRGSTWRGEVAGALNATASLLPFVISYAFIAFGAIGSAAAQVGLGASVIAIALGGAAMAALSGSRMPTGSPTASVSLILGSAVLALVRDPALAVNTPAGLGLLLACTGLMVVAAGLLTMLLGVLQAGSLVRFVPQPVLAGLMNGVAILIVLAQVPPLLGLPPGALARDGLRALASWQGPSPLIALATGILMMLAARRWPRAPAPLITLVIAGFAVHAWQANAPPASAGAALLQIGPLSASLPSLEVLAPLTDASRWPSIAPHGPMLAITAVLVALVGSLESVLNFTAIQQRLDARGDPNRELIAAGASSVLSGLLGGLPIVFARNRALATLSAGGRSAVSVWLSCVLLAAMFTFALPLIRPLSTAVVAGVVIMLAGGLVDRWTHGLVSRWWAGDRSADLRRSLAIVAVVSAAMIVWGLVTGVAVGVAVSVLMFIRTLNRQLVRARYTAADFPSRRAYAGDDEAVLAPLRSRIAVLELEGALFFGSADRLVQEAEGAAAGTGEVIVDLRRVSTVDASGAVAITQLGQRLARRGIGLRLAGVRPEDRHGQALQAHGVSIATTGGASAAGALPAYPDVDQAIEAAELQALDHASPGRTTRRVALADCRLLEGLDAAQRAALAPHLHERALAAGERLFAEGAPGRALYLLTEGSISVVDARRGQRFATFSPGMCFGETAVLDGGGRTADALADVASVVHELSKDSFDELQRSDPELAARLYRNLSRHLSERLRSAAAGWRRAAD